MDVTEAADYETAISATGYGKFNLLLLAAILPSALSQVFEVEGVGYVIPIAQCDLGLTLGMKGILNSVCQSGMVVSGFFWGYVIDIFGRRRTLVYGYMICTICSIVGGLSQNLIMLILAKFFTGFVITGPFSAAAIFLTEYHSKENRARIQLVRGMWITSGSLLLSFLSWIVLPWSFKWTIMDCIDLHSWNLFFLICSLMPLLGSIGFYLLPESPKFLMTAGKNAEALNVLQRMYSMNMGKPENTYPIVHLQNELEDATVSIDPTNNMGSFYIFFHTALFNLKQLFQRPHIYKLLLVCLNAYLILIVKYTMKFWMPQLLSSANDYKHSHNGSSSSTCDMLDDLRSNSGSNSSSVDCSVKLDDTDIYVKASIIGMAQIIGAAITATVVNFLGKKTISLTYLILAGAGAICIYVSPNTNILTLLLGVVISASELAANLMMTTTLEIFPTKIRGSAFTVYLLSGRLGSVTGNLVFPYLLNSGCLPPFLFLGLVMFASFGLTTLYPNTENRPLE